MTAEHTFRSSIIAEETALIYCRVSSRKQMKEGNGLDSQEHRCRQHALTRGYLVEKSFLEGVSGGLEIEDRPALQELLRYLDANKSKSYVIIFDDHKRFARETEMHLRLKRELHGRGARVEYLNVTIEDTPEGKFMEIMLAAQAQLEREQNARQTKEKTKARLEQGFWTFRAPVGYKYIRSVRGSGKELVRDEPAATILQEALEGFASGRFASQAEMQQFLNGQPEFTQKLPSGKANKQTVSQILDQLLYSGHYEAPSFGISLRKGNHEGLVTLETFEKIQERRKEKSYLPVRKDVHKDFVLRGAVCCDECKTPLRSGWTKGRTKYYAYYACHTKSCEHYGKSIARDELESEFEALLKTMQPSKAVFHVVKTMFKDAWEAQAATVKQNAVSFRREAEKAEKEIGQLVKRIMDANSPRVIAAYESRIDELEKHKLICLESVASLKKREFERSERQLP